MNIVLQVLFWQAVVITIIALVLKKTLDGMLLDSARRCLASGIDDAGRIGTEETPPSGVVTVTIVSHKPLGAAVRKKFEEAAVRRGLPAGILTFTVDRAIKGGIILRVGERVDDFSLRSRWQQAFGNRIKGSED